MADRTIGDLVRTFRAFKAKILLTSPQTVAFSATPAIDVSLGDPIDITLTGNITSMTFTNGIDGQKITLRLRQDGTGSRTLAFGAGVRFGTDVTALTLSTVASRLDYVGLIYNGADAKYDVVAFSRGYS